MSEKLAIGSIVEGKVIRIKPFGAIVSVGAEQGLVHISQVSNQFVEDINTHLKVDDVVKVKVLSIDSESNKIALSIKEAMPKTKPTKQEPTKPAHQKSNSYAKSANAPASDFEDKMKDWMKQSTERQTTLNKRANKRSY
ncbi:MAG: S1 RNA-binding domain-containing protein [Bacillota bacterium]